MVVNTWSPPLEERPCCSPPAAWWDAAGVHGVEENPLPGARGLGGRVRMAGVAGVEREGLRGALGGAMHSVHPVVGGGCGIWNE